MIPILQGGRYGIRPKCSPISHSTYTAKFLNYNHQTPKDTNSVFEELKCGKKYIYIETKFMITTIYESLNVLYTKCIFRGHSNTRKDAITDTRYPRLDA